jgi:hypothetical protein
MTDPLECAIHADVFQPAGMAGCSYCGAVVPVVAVGVDRLTGRPVLYYPAEWWDAHNPGCLFNEPLPRECPF